jgi:hypothetical protein
MNTAILCPSQEKLMERFDARLGKQSEIIKNLLIETNAVISGSFILQLITDTQYPYSDIDFCILSSSDKVETMIQSFWENETPRSFEHYTKCKEILNIYDKIVDLDLEDKDKETITQTKTMTIISSTTKTTITETTTTLKMNELDIKWGGRCKNDTTLDNMINEINFQLIIVDCPSMNDYIQNFDIDVCKNYFDGKHFYSHHLDDILTKKTTIHYSEHFKIDMGLMLWRFIKYVKRGYCIRFDDEFGKEREYNDSFRSFYHSMLYYNKKKGWQPHKYNAQLQAILNDKNVLKIFYNSSRKFISLSDIDELINPY